MKIYIIGGRDTCARQLVGNAADTKLVPVFLPPEILETDLYQLRQDGAAERAILLGGKSGLARGVERVRASGADNPVIVIQNVRDPRLSAVMLGAGADDVMVTPLEPVELCARIQAIQRRRFGRAKGTITLGELKIFANGQSPEVCGKPLELTRTEAEIFQHLIARADGTVTRAGIYEMLYGLSDRKPFERTIDVHIHKLRRKIGALSQSGHMYVETRPGGYRISGP